MDATTTPPATLPSRRARRRSYRGDARFARSAISNGKETLPNVDNRSGFVRRYKDIVSSIVTDLGGADMVPETKMQVVRRFAYLCCSAEQLEAKAAAGEPINGLEHAQLSAAIGRLAAKIGTTRVAKEINTLGAALRSSPP
jgi:hypothetical protein